MMLHTNINIIAKSNTHVVSTPMIALYKYTYIVVIWLFSPSLIIIFTTIPIITNL